MTIAVYAGSFDPITNGHLDLIFRAAQQFTQLIVAVGINSSKKPFFSTEEREQLIQSCIQNAWDNELGSTDQGWGSGELVHPSKISITHFDGLLVDFCRSVNATVIVRGLRAVTDFEAELGIAHANHSMVAHIDTFFLPTRPKFSFVSSSTVREIARHASETGWASLDQYVSPVVKAALVSKFKQ